MSLRPLPADTWPGDHLVLLDLTRWRKHNDDEECHCDNPRIELCLSPLGAPVELNWGSANHRLSTHDAHRDDLFPHAHPGIVAEALWWWQRTADFVALVLSSTVAAEHILSLPVSCVDEGRLAEAQHCVRATLARVAACSAAKEALR